MSQLLDAIAGVPNACEPIHGIVTGGQPAPEHLAALKGAGCEVVIDIREAMEPRPFKTPDAVVQAGLEYRRRRQGIWPLCQYILISVILPFLVSQKIAPRASTQSPLRRRR